MRACIVHIPFKLLAEMLQLPPEAKIIRVFIDPYKLSGLNVTISGIGREILREDALIPMLSPQVDIRRVVTVDWRHLPGTGDSNDNRQIQERDGKEMGGT